MGSSSSKGKKHQDTSKYGEIYLQTDRTAYHAGETVTGTIHLNLISDYPGNQLFLKFKGKESVDFIRREGSGKHAHNVRYQETVLLINNSIPVYTWEILSPGQFSIPFSFLLPTGLPASFYQQGYHFLAFIEYQIEAYLKPTSDTDPKLKYKQPLAVRETVVPSQGLSQTVTKKLETCCCCEQGTSTVKANFEKDAYYPGEKATVTMELDSSKTSLKNQKIKFSLRQHLSIKAKSITLANKFTNSKLEITDNLQEFSNNPGTLTIDLPRFVAEADFQNKFNKYNPSRSDILGLTNPGDLLTATTKGELITSTFYLEIACRMSGCCSTTPKAKLPIGILSPEFQLPAVTPPLNWQPSSLDPVNLAFAPSTSLPNQGLANNQNGNMVQGQMVANNMSSPQQVNLEIAPANQYQATQDRGNIAPSGEYNQNYFQNYN